MANEQNLQPGNVNHTFTREEALRGAHNSAISRGRKKAMKKPMSDFAKIISKSEITDEGAIKALRAAGIDDDHMINAALVAYGVFKAAVMGDMKAVEKWQQLVEGTAQASEPVIRIVMDTSAEDLSE